MTLEEAMKQILEKDNLIKELNSTIDKQKAQIDNIDLDKIKKDYETKLSEKEQELSKTRELNQELFLRVSQQKPTFGDKFNDEPEVDLTVDDVIKEIEKGE